MHNQLLIPIYFSLTRSFNSCLVFWNELYYKVQTLQFQIFPLSLLIDTEHLLKNIYISHEMIGLVWTLEGKLQSNPVRENKDKENVCKSFLVNGPRCLCHLSHVQFPFPSRC